MNSNKQQSFITSGVINDNNDNKQSSQLTALFRSQSFDTSTPPNSFQGCHNFAIYTTSTTVSSVSSSTSLSTRSHSEPIEITPERTEAFREFLLSLPRKCSPTFGGMFHGISSSSSSTSTPVSSPLMAKKKKNISLESCLNNESQSSSLSVIEQQQQTDDNDSLAMDNDPNCGLWSIDEYAELYGSDFDNVSELEAFHSYESEHLSKHFITESEQYFSQQSILPSPNLSASLCCKAKPKIDMPNQGTIPNTSLFTRRSTEEFLAYIESLKPKDHINHKRSSSSNKQTDWSPNCYIEDNDDDIDKNKRKNEQFIIEKDSLLDDEGNHTIRDGTIHMDDDVSKLVSISNTSTNTTTTNAITSTIGGTNMEQKKSFVDSDFVSLGSSTTFEHQMNISDRNILISQSPSTKAHWSNANYLDFSPISPIGRRIPNNYGDGSSMFINGGGQTGFTANTTPNQFTYPLTSFGSANNIATWNKFDHNISPIVPICNKNSNNNNKKKRSNFFNPSVSSPSPLSNGIGGTTQCKMMVREEIHSNLNDYREHHQCQTSIDTMSMSIDDVNAEDDKDCDQSMNSMLVDHCFDERFNPTATSISTTNSEVAISNLYTRGDTNHLPLTQVSSLSCGQKPLCNAFKTPRQCFTAQIRGEAKIVARRTKLLFTDVTSTPN